MNRYVIDGIVRDVVDGKNVGLVAVRHRHARKVFDLVREWSPDWPDVCLARGREALRTWNGSLHVFSLDESGYDLPLDVVVLVDGLRPLEWTRREEVLLDIQSAWGTRTSGLEIIYCE